MRSRFTKYLSILVSAVVLTGLAGCDGQVPQPVAASSSASPSPDLTQTQEKKIRTTILKALDAANTAKSTDNLGERMTGPALQVRTSEIDIAKATGSLDPKTTIPKATTQIIVPTDSGWPRSVFTITTTTADQQSKRLLVMTQDDARSNYKLWGVARLFQGAKLPKFAVSTIGSEMGAKNDTGLVATPLEAVTEYADVLQNGSSSKYASDVANDYFRQDLDKLAQTVQEGMERNNGTQEQEFSPVQGELQVMRSTDGGDLVVAQINSQWTRKAGEGRESQPASDAEKALFANGKATSTMRVTYVNVIALYVPPAHSGKPITAVGAERQPIKVEAL
jgi:hypothetical protein